MNEPDYELHDAAVIGVNIQTASQPISLTIEVEHVEKKKQKVIFEQCAGIEAFILGGVLSIPEMFDHISKQESVSEQFKDMAFAHSTYEVTFTGGSRFLVTCIGYKIQDA